MASGSIIMKVILLENIKSLGNKYDVKEIKEGYARNFLFPRKLAKIATETAIKELELQKIKQEQQEQKLKLKAEKLAKDLSGREFKFEIKTGKKDEIFGSITKDKIKKALAENGIKAEVLLDKPLKTLGEHQVEINLHPLPIYRCGGLGKGVKSEIKVVLHSQP